MVDIDPEILNNPELGKASHLPYLTEVEAQLKENLDAKREGREPETVPTSNENATGAVAVHGFTTELQRRNERADSTIAADKEIADEDWNKAGRPPQTEEQKEAEEKKTETEKATGNTTESSSKSTQEAKEANEMPDHVRSRSTRSTTKKSSS